MSDDERFGGLDPKDEEYGSVETLVEYLFDEELDYFTASQLQCLNFRLRVRTQLLKAELESYGLRFVGRPVVRRTRGFTANPHDRFYGPGSSPMHGGSGWEQVSGFAGQTG